MKQNQIIAIANGEKKKLLTSTTPVYHILQKEDLFNGFSRRYEPFEDDTTGANKLPGEDKIVQQTVKQALAQLQKDLVNPFNVIATQDIGNCNAKADIVVDGVAITKDVPVTHLIWLEKRITDMRTMFATLPVVDPAETWSYDSGISMNKTSEKVAFRTKKVPRVLVKAEATDKFQAQTEVYNEDVNVGKWYTIKYSGAVTMAEKAAYLSKIDNLIVAIKKAREEANSADVSMSDIGTKVINYLFG